MPTVSEQLQHARQDDYSTVPQFCLLTGYSLQSVYRRIWAGALPGVIRLGRTYRIHTQEALKALEVGSKNASSH